MDIVKLSTQYRGYLERWLSDNRREEIDIDAEWDSREDFNSNKKMLARKYNIPYQSSDKKGYKTGTQEHYVNNPKRAKAELQLSACDEISFQCENKCNNNACRSFKKYGCAGEVEPCDV